MDQVVSRHFEEAADTYARYVAPCFHPVAQHLAESLAARLDRTPAPSQRLVVLDVGCGDGRLAATVAARLAGRVRVVGVDLSAALLKRAARWASTGSAMTRAMTWVRADAQRLPVADGSVDVAVCSMAMPFFADPPAAAAELARVVRDDGEVVLASVGTAGRSGAGGRAVTLRSRVALRDPEALIGFFAGQVPTGGRPPDPLQAAAMLEQAGGEIVVDLAFTVAHLRRHGFVPARSAGTTASTTGG